jgi:hypothetical protein
MLVRLVIHTHTTTTSNTIFCPWDTDKWAYLVIHQHTTTTPNTWDSEISTFFASGLLTCWSTLSSTHTTTTSNTIFCLGILKIAFLSDFTSYEDVLHINVNLHDVNLLLVPFSTTYKTSNMLLTLFEKGC